MSLERQPASADSAASPDPVDERALVDHARAGDRVAFGALYDLYFERIYRFALVRVRNSSDAEDLTAEIFIRVMQALPRFEWQPNVPFQAWLFRVAANHVYSHFRRAVARPALTVPGDTEFIDPHVGPDQLVEQKLTLEEIRTAAEKLPEAQRRVIELRFGAGLSVKETAQVLKKTENNVKVLQHKATARLQRLLRTR